MKTGHSEVRRFKDGKNKGKLGFDKVLSRSLTQNVATPLADASAAQAESVAAAQQFVHALQRNEINREKLMELINTPIEELSKTLRTGQ